MLPLWSDKIDLIIVLYQIFSLLYCETGVIIAPVQEIPGNQNQWKNHAGNEQGSEKSPEFLQQRQIEPARVGGKIKFPIIDD